ncbi:MAG: hypothetical protein WC982_09925 [Advenella sp.]
MNKFKMLALTIPFVCAANTSYALEERTVYSPTGESVFQIRFFDQDARQTSSK